MSKLKSILEAISRLGCQILETGRSLGVSIRARRQRAVLDVAEAERLDRIRNPSKYVGK